MVGVWRFYFHVTAWQMSCHNAITLDMSQTISFTHRHKNIHLWNEINNILVLLFWPRTTRGHILLRVPGGGAGPAWCFDTFAFFFYYQRIYRYYNAKTMVQQKQLRRSTRNEKIGIKTHLVALKFVSLSLRKKQQQIRGCDMSYVNECTLQEFNMGVPRMQKIPA